MLKASHGMKGYLDEMLRQFDPSGTGSLENAKRYLKSLDEDWKSTGLTLAANTEYGPYTLAKHLFLYEYLRPFFSIGGLKFRRLVYIDMFAGPGINAISDDGRSFITPGSPLISYLYTFRTKDKTRVDRFDSYYFYEASARKAKILQDRLDRLRADFKLAEEARVIPRDSQDEVWKTMEGEINSLKKPKKTEHRNDRGILFLLFIDPEGLGLKFDLLLKFLKRYVATADGEDTAHYFTADVIYTAPTHWSKQSGYASNLELYCGISPTRQYSDEEVASLMGKRIREEVGGKCFVNSIPVRNSKNALQYHIISATKSQGAANGAESLIKPLGLRARDLQSALESLMGDASTIDDFWVGQEKQ